MLDFYLFKQVYDLFLQGKNTEAKAVLMDLQEKFIEVHDENSLLKTQVQEYEDILYIAKNLEYNGFSYWLKTGAVRQGPFCQQCFDKDGLLIRLTEHKDSWKCLTCGSVYANDKGRAVDRKSEEHTHKPDNRKVIQLYK